MAISILSNPVAKIGAQAMRGLGRRVERWANEESFGQDPNFLADDLGWIPIAMGENPNSGRDMRPLDRMMVVKRARIYGVHDAMSRQAIRLYNAYCVGRGFSIKARDYKTDNADVGANPETTPGVDTADQLSQSAREVQLQADMFWEHPDNASALSTEAQSTNCDQLLIDGELFYVLIPPNEDTEDWGDDGNEGVTRVRLIKDCLQITQIIRNPEDDSEIWYYLRCWQEKGEERRVLYPDYRLFFNKKLRRADGTITLPSVSMAKGSDPLTVYGGDLDGAKVLPTHFILHRKINTIGDRGNSLLAPAMDWSKVNRQYLEDRATISRAHAKFAWKRMIKGPASAVAAFGKKNVSANQAVTGQPLPTMAGSTLNVNQGVDWEPMNANDGGKNAYIESRNFRLMFYAAVGFAEHYFGDGSNGTRATSKSMERPTELILQAFQTILKDSYEVMFAFHLTAIGRKYDAHAVWVDAPSILEDDTATVINSILSVIGVLPQFDIDEVILKMLAAFAIDDPQDVLVKIRARQKELWQQNYALALAQAGLDASQVGGANNPTDPAAQQNVITSQQKLIAMLTPPGDPSRQPGPKVSPQFAQPGTKGGPLAQRKPTPTKLRPTDPQKV